MILSYFKSKYHRFDYFYKKIGQKNHKIGGFGCKNHQNLKKIQRSIIIP